MNILMGRPPRVGLTRGTVYAGELDRRPHRLCSEVRRTESEKVCLDHGVRIKKTDTSPIRGTEITLTTWTPEPFGVWGEFTPKF